MFRIGSEQPEFWKMTANQKETGFTFFWQFSSKILNLKKETAEECFKKYLEQPGTIKTVSNVENGQLTNFSQFFVENFEFGK